MPRLTLVLLSLCLCVGINIHAQKSPNLSSPKKTFKLLRKAIKNKDLELYTQLWYEPKVEREGMISDLKKSDKTWVRLQGIFTGPQKIMQDEYSESEGQKFYRCRIKAPKAKGGGIGTMRMILHEGQWLMYSW